MTDNGKVDYLLDFKSNIITGQQMPSGTGHKRYFRRLKKNIEQEQELFLEFSFEDELEEELLPT